MRYQALDGWRGVTAILVAIFHLNVYDHFHSFGLVKHAFYYVDFFFVLSGFVISATYERKIVDNESLILFIVRRISRIYPLHLTILSAFVAVELAKTLAYSLGASFRLPPFEEPNDLTSVITSILLLKSFGIHRDLTWNFPSWSISSEFYVYIVFGLLVSLTSMIAKRWRYTLFAATLALGAVILMLFSPRGIDATYDFGFFRCLYGFFCGVFVWKFYQSRPVRSLPFASIWEIAILIAASSFVIYVDPHGKLSFTAPLLLSIMVYIFAFQGGIVSRILILKPFQILGKISYSIYLVHAFIVINIIDRAASLFQKVFSIQIMQAASGTDESGFIAGETVINLGTAFQGDLLCVAYILLVVGVSYCTFTYIEMPWQSRLNRGYISAMARSRVIPAAVFSKSGP